MGVNTLVRPELRGLGNYAIASSRVDTALLAIVDARAAPAGAGVRLVLFNDRFNRRQRVESVLKDVGLSEAEAQQAMMDAHTTGRGVVRVFKPGPEMDLVGAMEAAEMMCGALAKADLLVELEHISASCADE